MQLQVALKTRITKSITTTTTTDDKDINKPIDKIETKTLFYMEHVSRCKTAN